MARGTGFDIELHQALAEVVDVPVTAFDGAGNIQYFVDLFTKINVTGALVGALLHNKVLTIKDIKRPFINPGRSKTIDNYYQNKTIKSIL